MAGLLTAVAALRVSAKALALSSTPQASARSEICVEWQARAQHKLHCYRCLLLAPGLHQDGLLTQPFTVLSNAGKPIYLNLSEGAWCDGASHDER
jgi:hypothetical protein